MKKRASQFLPENVVSIIIGAIILIGFGLGVYTWYQTAQTDTEFASASSTIRTIKGKIDALKVGQENDFPFQGFAGKQAWYIKGYSNTTINRPEKCFFESCICVSPYPTPISCDNEGNHEIIDAGEIIIEGVFPEKCITVKTGPEDYDTICTQSETPDDFIIIPKNFYLLHISKEKINNEVTVAIKFNRPENEQ